jgi:large subunit ribosomal protein L23
MALNIFKKQSAKPVEEKVEEKKEVMAKKETKKTEIKSGKISINKNNEAWKILKFPRVTEKSAMLAEENFYVFQVATDSNKTEIKKAVEAEYGVRVKDIKIINIPRKRVQRGRIEGVKSGYKKALVKLNAGEKIDILTK